MPPYTPELNSIESLWSVVKGDIKKQLLHYRQTQMTQDEFRSVINGALGRVTPLQQQRAARHNNRHFIHQVLTEIQNPAPPVPVFFLHEDVRIVGGVPSNDGSPRLGMSPLGGNVQHPFLQGLSAEREALEAEQSEDPMDYQIYLEE